MWWVVVDYSNSITWTHSKTMEHTRVLWCVTALSNEELSLEASVLLNEAKKSFTTSFISQMKAAQITKKETVKMSTKAI